jgi:uncharacterized cofD-like protein
MNIVCIGGGHGLAQVLKSLKNISSNLVAIVTTTDNGGSTGRIREDKNEIALGDIRRCISSLSDKNCLLSEVTEQRFNSKNDLNNHCLGNIILSALCQYVDSPTKAIQLYSELLNLDVKHKIYPMTNDPSDLIATNSKGDSIFGECNIDKLDEFPSSISLTNNVLAEEEVIKAIYKADIILLGPGSLLTSVLPVLLVSNIKEAIINTSASRIFIGNMTKENSIVDKIPEEYQLEKAIKLLGYKFFDISLSPKAIKILTSINKKNNKKNNENKFHDEKQLEYIIKQFSSQHIKKNNNETMNKFH